MKFEYYISISYVDGRNARIGFFTYSRAEEFYEIATEFDMELGISVVGPIEKA